MRILDNARSMTLLETDMNQGYKQYQSASEQYHGLTISIEGDTFAFAAPLWNWYGKEYRSMQYAPGLHFDELPENTPQEKSLKQKIATALFVAEIQQILSGNAFDCDRHEWQYKMHRQSNGQYMIYAFDHGGMSMDKPNLTEKVKLTGLLNTVFSRIAEGGEILITLPEFKKVSSLKVLPLSIFQLRQ
jgi:predicted unusual protein kinase regulating ubiquinone biosynthesis (AarF/ABC1/UbiB family)